MSRPVSASTNPQPRDLVVLNTCEQVNELTVGRLAETATEANMQRSDLLGFVSGRAKRSAKSPVVIVLLIELGDLFLQRAGDRAGTRCVAFTLAEEMV